MWAGATAQNRDNLIDAARKGDERSLRSTQSKRAVGKGASARYTQPARMTPSAPRLNSP